MAGLHELVASAFGLGRPLSGLDPIQAASYETWRLDSARGSFLVKRLWSGEDPPSRSELEIAMDLERRAMQAGIATSAPVTPVEPAFGWAARIDGHGVWRVYEWLDHTTLDTAQIDHRWFGDTLSLLHKLYPLDNRFEPEWRWLGVYPRDSWERWLHAAACRGRTWAETAGAELDRVLVVTDHVRNVYQSAPDHIVSHLDFGPWNVLNTADGLVLIDWENAGPTTASTELGRAVAAFGQDDPARMRRLIEAYQEAGGGIVCRPDDLFTWLIAQQLSGITERIRIELDELDEDDDPEPSWMNCATVDQDIINALTSLTPRLDDLRGMAARVMAEG